MYINFINFKMPQTLFSSGFFSWDPDPHCILQAFSYEVTGKHWFCNNKWPERSGFLLLLRINLPSLFIHDIITVNVSISPEMSDTGNYGQELHFFVLQEWRCNAFDISNIKIEWKQIYFFFNWHHSNVRCM